MYLKPINQVLCKISVLKYSSTMHSEVKACLLNQQYSFAVYLCYFVQDKSYTHITQGLNIQAILLAKCKQ